MLYSRVAGVPALALSFSFSIANAQTLPTSERMAAIHEKMANIDELAITKLPPRLQQHLSSGARNFLQFATAWPRIEQIIGRGPDSEAKLAAIQDALKNRPRVTPSIVSFGPVPVSNPAVDFLFSVTAGFTQSETSTAWCGSGVVVGFNDSGSELESMLFGPGGISSTGAGASIDGGNSFRDIGFINPGSNALLGDPVMNCADASTFYLSQIGLAGTIFQTTSANVFLSKSTDGGFTWGDPIPAVSKDPDSHILDKDWSAIDHKNPRYIYVSYTDFDETGGLICPGFTRFAIEIVHSADGGSTWSAPTVVTEVCDAPPNPLSVDSSHIVVGSQGNVYVDWEVVPLIGSNSTRELRIARSTNHAATFGPSSLIDTVTPTGIDTETPTGIGFVLQGNFLTQTTGNLTIDQSGTKSDGNLYVTWQDGRFRSRVDLQSSTGLYHNANVLFSRSVDHGKTWSLPVRINNDPLESSAGFGIDHFQPGIAVDASGALAACWYDRRDDPLNYQIARYCGTSTDQGATWSNLRVDPTSWPPIHDVDLLVDPQSLGDYDTVASDSLKTIPGFQGAYGKVTFVAPVANQDVFLVHVNSGPTSNRLPVGP